MIKKVYQKGIIVAQVVLIFVLPLLLFHYGFIDPSARFFFICLSSLIIYGIIKHEKWTYEDLGIGLHNFKSGFWPYVAFTVLGVAVLLLSAKVFNVSTVNDQWTLFRKFLLFLPLSFFQEFAYRSFLMKKLEMLFDKKWLIVLVNAFLFMILHIFYPPSILMLPLAFVGGVAFAYMYIKHPNLLLIGLSHSVLNITAVLLGFFVF
jgi:membrane protease YdiL (CAAX protease family)